jgi:predicted nucleic acid-binding Zn ribbon protein
MALRSKYDHSPKPQRCITCGLTIDADDTFISCRDTDYNEETRQRSVTKLIFCVLCWRKKEQRGKAGAAV